MLIGATGTASVHHQYTTGAAASFTSSAFALFASLPARLLLALTLSVPAVFMFCVHSAVHHIDQATRRQCATGDWPAHQTAAHLEICRAYIAANP